MSRKSWWSSLFKEAKELSPREKAEDLLKSILTEEERLEVWKYWRLTIPTPRGKFVVNGFINPEDEAPIFNVEHEDGTKYCLHLGQWIEGYPRYDHLAAQILLLKTDPDRFMREANNSNAPPTRHAGRRVNEFACERDRGPFPGAIEMLERINVATGRSWTLRVPARIDDFDTYQRFVLSSDSHSFVIGVSNYEIREMADAQLIRYLETHFMEAIRTNFVGRRDEDIDVMYNGTWRW